MKIEVENPELVLCMIDVVYFTAFPMAVLLVLSLRHITKEKHRGLYRVLKISQWVFGLLVVVSGLSLYFYYPAEWGKQK